MKYSTILVLFLLLACNSATFNGNNNSNKNLDTLKKDRITIADSAYTNSDQLKDTVYKFGSFSIPCRKGMKYDLIVNNQTSKTRVSKGDTLYRDKDTIILGDIRMLLTGGVYAKGTFYYSWR
jgi:hypothetical protein